MQMTGSNVRGLHAIFTYFKRHRLASGLHKREMYTPLYHTFISVYLFCLIFVPKHRLWILVRTASTSYGVAMVLFCFPINKVHVYAYNVKQVTLVNV